MCLATDSTLAGCLALAECEMPLVSSVDGVSACGAADDVHRSDSGKFVDPA